MADEYEFDNIYQLSHQNGQIPFLLDRDIGKYRPQEEQDFSLANKAGQANIDAFNRLRVSEPLTLFDSSHRYNDNDLWSEFHSGPNSSGVFNPNQGLMDLNVDSTSGSQVLRETTKIFSYQPGKSLLIMTTFVMNPAKEGLRERVGYFGTENGYYFQKDDFDISFVERSSTLGSIQENIVLQENWNTDKLDGTGKSGITLDASKGQILWADIEWLGIGTVRMGFVIDGQFIICHKFHHANLIPRTYITTASLPLRCEITNKTATSSSSTLKQICSTVISEGGYKLNGLQQAVGTSIVAPKDLGSAATRTPVVTLRLKADRSDAVVILTAVSLLPSNSNANYRWELVASAVSSGGTGTWISSEVDSSVEYKLDATAVTGGRILAAGYTQGSNQGSNPVDLLKNALFKFQLERDSFNGTNYELALVCSSDTSSADIFGSLDWEEVSR
tara:strand:- start:557 stop:1891 length:1335 start_codon:yes stop_codon:yes gene_type:complete